MATQRDIEQLLRNIPLATPADESKAADVLQMFIGLRNAAFEGHGLTIPGIGIPFSIPSLINQMKAGNYTDVALTLISVGGEATGTYSLIVTAGVEAGAIPVTSATASAGVVAGMVAELAPAVALAATVMVATLRIPRGVNENNSKLFFLSDASGILTSWMFNMPEINPHAQLTQEARTGGYNRADISEQCRLAHERVHHLWRSNYQGNSSARQQTRQQAGKTWKKYWLGIGRALEQRLDPAPTGIGTAWVRDLTSKAEARIRRTAISRYQQNQRRAAGGYWLRTSEGLELFIPDR